MGFVTITHFLAIQLMIQKRSVEIGDISLKKILL